MTGDGDRWKGRLDAAVDSFADRIVTIRRHLHAHPEPSGEEVRTTRFLRDRLEEAGIDTRIAMGEIGLIAQLPENPREAAGRIGLRADIDALRIQDAKECEYRSRTPGVMHACGHDGHSAVVLGAMLALHLAACEGALPWPVRCRALFQPAEETNRGALAMIAAGALHGLDALLSLHMDPSRPAGEIGVRPGILTADCDELHIRITGKGGHASRPHDSIDPIAAAAQLINAIYLFVPRRIDSHDPVVITIGQIHGGENYNVIPNQVVLRGTMRSLGGEIRQKAMEHIHAVARGIAQASGARIEIKFLPGPPSVLNDARLTDLIRAVGVDLLGPERVRHIARASMGGEDFAHYLVHVSGGMFRLGCATAAPGRAMLHSPEFDIDERALAIGAKILARCVVRWSRPEG